MYDLPVFDHHPYNVIRALSRHQDGGSLSYLAAQVETGQPVIIKQFRFAQIEASWQGYKAYQREIEILQRLDHPRIPRYLDAFETADGFCLVQEYKPAPSLAEPCYYSWSAVKTIALSVLEILVDLQAHVPLIIHRDLKPEHILVNPYGQAYLVSLGLARMQAGPVAISSIAAGTPGFIPPEELFDRPLTAAADLYSLGATLIAVLTQTKSTEMSHLMDEAYRFNLEVLPPSLSPPFIDWLACMVAPQVRQRFANAAEALAALRPIPMDAAPEQPQVSHPYRRVFTGGIAIAGLLVWELLDPVYPRLPLFRRSAPAMAMNSSSLHDSQY